MHFFVSGMVWEKTVPLHRRPETCKQNGGRNTGAGLQDPEKNTKSAHQKRTEI